MAYGVAFIAILVGLASVFESTLIAKNHDKAIYWFIFAMLAILIPYVREITFKDLKVVIDKIDVATKTLDDASISVKELNNRINQTRDELIDGYQLLLKMLPEEERKNRVIKLSKLYLREMGVEISTVKKWLVEMGQSLRSLDNTMDDEYLTAVKNIQQANGLGDDGIFGYRTLNLIYQLRNKDEKT